MAAFVRVPGDKSVSHRALILSALAPGASRLEGLNTGADVQATAAALRALGVDLDFDPGWGTAVVRGGAPFHGPPAPLDCGNSGTTARLLLGLLAGGSTRARLTGDASLRRRPMDRVAEPLRAAGAVIVEEGEPGRLPLRVEAPVRRAIDHASPVASAQVKGALLLAGLAARVPVVVREPHLSRDHTERMLRARGVPVAVEEAADGRATVTLAADAPPPRPLDQRVPGDISAAVFWVVWSLLARRPLVVPDVGLNPTRTGALDVLRRMGAELAVTGVRDEGGEPVGDLAVRPGPLAATEVAPAEVPRCIDEIPALATAAVRARGTFAVRGASELRVKESDRIRALVENLRALGVACRERPDGLEVEGTDRPLRGRVRTFGDHRIAMAFGVLAAVPGNEIALDDPDCAAVSYPGFWETLRGLAARA